MKSKIGDDLARLKLEKRLAAIDQAAKLQANASHIVATDAGAIGGIWHSHGEHDKSYDARKDHLARAGKIYLIRDSWADRDGLLKPVNGYMDEITMPAQEFCCRCFYQYVTSPRRLPPEFLTQKGRDWIEKGRAAAKRLLDGG